ncbi:unnamed protein product, partial [marine sediment metagenome]
ITTITNTVTITNTIIVTNAITLTTHTTRTLAIVITTPGSVNPPRLGNISRRCPAPHRSATANYFAGASSQDNAVLTTEVITRHLPLLCSHLA